MVSVMRKIGKGCATFIAFVLLTAMLTVFVANNQTGRTAIIQLVAKLTANGIIITGVSGQLTDTLAVEHIELHDADGVWLSIEQLALAWSPIRLLTGTVEIHRLTAARITVNRLPPPTGQAQTSFSLPVTISLDTLQVQRLELAAAVVGKPAGIAVDGAMQWISPARADIGLTLQRLDAAGLYQFKGNIDDNGLNAQLTVQEPAQGLLATLAGLQEQQPLSVSGRFTGPLSAVDTDLTLQFGALSAALRGWLDIQGEHTDLSVTANAPAIRLRPKLSWQALALNGRLQGQLNQPTVNGRLQIDKLAVADTQIAKIATALTGNSGQLHLAGALDTITSAALTTDLLHGVPLTFAAELRLDLPDKSVAFNLKHPYLNAIGKANNQSAELALTLTELTPFAALGGVSLQGNSKLTLTAARAANTTAVAIDGALAITGGNPAAMQLLGDRAKFGVNLALNDTGVELSRFSLDGKTLNAQAAGRIDQQSTTGDWKVLVNDLSALSKDITGKLALQGQLTGKPDNFKVTADLSGDLGGQLSGKNFPRKPVTAKLLLENMPSSASGQINANGWLAGSPVELAIAVKNLTDAIQLAIERADWKTAHAQGKLLMPKTSGSFPSGIIDLRMNRLADLQPFLNQPLTGAATGTLAMTAKNGQTFAHLQAHATKSGLTELVTVADSTLDVTLSNLPHKPQLNGKLNLDGLSAKQMNGFLHLDFTGALDAVHLLLASQLTTQKDNELNLNSAATLNTAKKQLAVSKLQANWHKETLNLLAPAQFNFADGFSVDQLRLGIRQAELAVHGRITPNLAMTATVKRLPAALAAVIAPNLNATGSIDADAQLTGTTAHPLGNINLKATDLRLQSGSGAALPALQLTATAELNGENATLNSHINAGPDTKLDITGQLPTTATTPLNLHAAGNLDLKLLDPLLNAAGRRVRGQVKLDGNLAGTLSELSTTGTLQLDKAELRDYTLGINITAISALVKVNNGMMQIDKLEGRAGAGNISASGLVNLKAAGMPVELTVIARNARLLASDKLKVNLNTDLNVRGQATGNLTAIGSMLINSAEIRIPERLPASIAVLKIQTADTQNQPPPSPIATLTLNLVIDAPGKIFVRGRGLDAELYGTVHLRGTTDQPQPDGSFKLRQGEYNLAGKTLTFSQGTVGFDGGSLTDPSLNFISSTSSDNITATLTIGGTVSKPKISLSSVPVLPPDEILARLLFKHSTNTLSLVEMLQIGSAFASLTGIDQGIGDPLESVRNKLKLDRLSVGTNLEAGRYVMPGIYLGAKKGIIGNSTQATIQIDVTKQLKIEATIGTATTTGKTTNTNSLGIIYQYDY